MRFYLALFLLLCSKTLEAVPSFARNLGVDCNVCHTAYPQLTEYGKIFLETGGEILIQKDYGKLAMTPEVISGHVYLLPVDKHFSADSTTALTNEDKQLQLRAYSEVNAYLAGRTGKVFFFTVFSATDDNGFSVTFDEGFAMLNLLSNSLNIFGGFDSPYITDGNDTVQHHNVLNRQWKAAEYTPDTSQMVGLNGMLGGFYWIATWNGAPQVTMGNDAQGYSLRAAYEVSNQTFGAYLSHNAFYDDNAEYSIDPFLFYGLDGHLRFWDTNILMVLGFRKLHHYETDWDFSIEANKIFTTNWKYLTEIIPIANLDIFVDRPKSNGLWLQGSAGVAFNINPSVRFLPQVSGTLYSPSEYKHKAFSVLLSADIGL